MSIVSLVRRGLPMSGRTIWPLRPCGQNDRRTFGAGVQRASLSTWLVVRTCRRAPGYPLTLVRSSPSDGCDRLDPPGDRAHRRPPSLAPCSADDAPVPILGVVENMAFFPDPARARPLPSSAKRRAGGSSAAGGAVSGGDSHRHRPAPRGDEGARWWPRRRTASWRGRLSRWRGLWPRRDRRESPTPPRRRAGR